MIFVNLVTVVVIYFRYIFDKDIVERLDKASLFLVEYSLSKYSIYYIYIYKHYIYIYIITNIIYIIMLHIYIIYIYIYYIIYICVCSKLGVIYM